MVPGARKAARKAASKIKKYNSESESSPSEDQEGSEFDDEYAINVCELQFLRYICAHLCILGC